MSQKTRILLISYIAAAMAALVGFSVAQFGTAGAYRKYNDTEYRRAMAQLVTCMDDLDSALQKGAYANGTVVTGKVCTQIYASAQGAETALSILPVDQYELEEVSGFIARMQDYAGAKVAATAAGKAFDGEDRETAARLHAVTGRLVEELSTMYEDLAGGALTIRGPKLTGLRANISEETGPTLEDQLYDLADGFPQTPELHYEGKYVADYDNSYRGLAGLNPITEGSARVIAQELLQLPDDGLTAAGKSTGDGAAFYFSAETERGNETVAVTELGGKILFYLNDRTPTEEKITDEQAQQAGMRFLEQAGYENMVLAESKREWGLVELRYVYVEGEVSALADAVQVTVSMEDGSILSLNAEEYLRNHHARGSEAPKLTRQQTQKIAVPEGLTVESAMLSYYTAESGRTDLCWRFRCQTEEGESCIIYASADTGMQIEIVTDTKTLVN